MDEIHGDGARPEALGTVIDGERRVRLYELTADEAKALQPALAVTHSYLARVLEILQVEGVAHAVVEYVPGTTLATRLAEIGRKPPVDAVRSALRVADAVSTLHHAGGAHGGLSASCVFVEAPQHDVPTVTWAPPNSRASGGLPSPERGADGPPSEADDTWAMTALLYLMLTGEAPPASGLHGLDELVSAGVTDDALSAALLHGLHADATARSHDLTPLKRELARWFVDHADEEPHSAHGIPSHPPPLPAPSSSAPPPHSGVVLSSGGATGVPRASLGGVASATPPAGKPRPRMPFIAGGAIALGLVAAWVWSATRGPRIVEIKKSVAPAAAPEKSAQAIDLGEVPVSASGTPTPGNETGTCVAAYLPKGAFESTPDLGWLCGESDPREGAAKLHAAIAKGAVGGTPTDATRLFDKLGWYELAAYSVLHSGCCMEAKLKLPAPSSGCDAIDVALVAIGPDAVAGKSIDEPLAKFSKAVACEVAAGKASAFKRTGKPAEGEEAAFREFVTQLQRR